MLDLDRPVLDKAPPYDLPAEEALLGGLLINRDAIIGVADWLQPADFYREIHGWIYAAIRALYQRREPPDIVTVEAELRQRDQLGAVGGLAYLAHLLHADGLWVHVEYYARVIQRCAVQRRIITVGGQIAGLGYDVGQEPAAVLTTIRELVAGIAPGGAEDWVSLSDVWDANLDEMQARQQGQLAPGIPTGFPTLQAVTNGWQAGDLILVAARTSRGKSALALHFAREAASAGYAVGVVSLEARKEALGQRMLAAVSDTDLGVLRAATLGGHDWERIGAAVAEHSEAAGRIWFLDRSGQTVDAIAAKVDQLRAWPGRGCDLLLVDYLQLLRGRGGRGATRETEVASISRDLKLLAMQAGIPVLALAQLNRAAIGADQPSLEHLRESGALEQDANLVLFLHRPAEDQPNLLHLVLAKQRDGVADVAIPLHWQGSRQCFEERRA